MELSSNLTTNKSWQNLFEDQNLVDRFCKDVFPNYMQSKRWFAGKGANINFFRLEFLLDYFVEDKKYYLGVIEVVLENSATHRYFIPLDFHMGNPDHVENEAIITPIKIQNEVGLLTDAIYSSKFRNDLFLKILNQDKPDTNIGFFQFLKGNILANESNKNINSRLLNADQSNTTIVYNDKYFLKIYRRLYREINPDFELTYFLSEKTKFQNSPKFAGSVTWKRENLPDISIGLMQQKIDHHSEAWPYMVGKTASFFEILEKDNIELSQLSSTSIYNPNMHFEETEIMNYLIGSEVLNFVQQLGLRTAEMHIALASDKTEKSFSPRNFNEDYSVWLKNRLNQQFDRRYLLVEQNFHKLKGLSKKYAQKVLDAKNQIKNFILDFDELKLISTRIRIHGDYHLGQVLIGENDLFILDFEGEPEATIRDRKVKQPPLKDVAGMLRSFHYAIYATIFNRMPNSNLTQEELFTAGEHYYHTIGGLFLKTYMEKAMEKSLNIGYQKEINYLLKYHLLEKAIYEMGYELNARPDWAIIPLTGLINLIEE
jgi:trehalose synthase-fused probable maltokinase